MKKINKKISYLRSNGFVNAGQIVFTQNEIDELLNICTNIFNKFDSDYKKGIKHEDFMVVNNIPLGFTRVPEHSERLSELINNLLNNKNITTILENILGKDYKIWQIVYRRSNVGDKGLSIHQDAYGETNMSILLSDNETYSGSTVFVPKSHLVKKNLKSLGIQIPSFLMRVFAFMLKPLSGKSGDIGFFFNYTWHGRYPNNNKVNNAILFSFFPATSSIGYDHKDYPKWSNNFLNKNNRLANLVDSKIGIKKRDDNRYEVLKKNINDDVPFVLKLQDPKIKLRKNYSSIIYYYIFILTILFKILIYVRNFFKLFKL